MRKPTVLRSLPLLLLCPIAACVPGGPPPPPAPLPPPPPRSQPTFPLPGPAITAAEPPPAMSGGTLLILADGKTAFAADPDRDRLYFVDLVTERLLATVALEPGDEPGRAVESRDGSVLVALRRGGAVVEVDPHTHQIWARVKVCAAPRGIDHDPATGETHVACAEGELVTLAAESLQVRRRLPLDTDLRDVVVSGDQLLVSRFRSAELLVLSAGGQLVERRRPPGSAAANRQLASTGRVPIAMDPNAPARPVMRSSEPGVGWRMRRGRAGGAILLHQEATNGELGTQSGGYGGGPCRSAIAAAFTEFLPAAGDARTGGQIPEAILPLDFSLSRDGRKLALVAAGFDPLIPGAAVQLMDTTQTSGQNGGDCVRPQPPGEPIEFRQPVGRPIAVAFDGQDRVVVQTREPARLEILSHRGGTIQLSADSREDTGHRVFHMAGRSRLACASCHPEGGEDARTWRFEGLGARRTQSLLGGVLATAPFHWDGDMRDLTHLTQEVFTGRMAGPALEAAQVAALGTWLDRLPPAPAPGVPSGEAAARGKLLFADARVACATCHSGPTFTSNASVDVGTGKALQVPSLRGLRSRAPYMHDGCAPTLMDRFSATCGGGDRHGVTSHLSPAQLADLVAYLETL